ncbi:MAG: sigma-70 family RNA polymerase sigma factor [Phycisphaerae bacterium]|nr:sigma-70 family RNA polymerase sigma factor [Phycisphaerae bacterium]
MEPKELADLVVECKAGSSQAYEQLVALYSPRLYGYLLRLVGRPDDAEELLQEVFLRLVRSMATYRHDGQLTAYLFRIATNVVRDRYRRKQVRPHQVSESEAMTDDDESVGLGDHVAGDEPEPDSSLTQRERAEALNKALARLPEEQRQVILLRHFSEMPFNEIADLLKCPVGTVLARAHRGLKRLRELMQDEP